MVLGVSRRFGADVTLRIRRVEGRRFVFEREERGRAVDDGLGSSELDGGGGDQAEEEGREAGERKGARNVWLCEWGIKLAAALLLYMDEVEVGVLAPDMKGAWGRWKSERLPDRGKVVSSRVKA